MKFRRFFFCFNDPHRRYGEAALLTALREKRIYGAGIDVFSSEPPAEKEWYTLDNIVMGSHTSSSTVDTTNRQGKMCVDALLAAKL